MIVSSKEVGEQFVLCVRSKINFFFILVLIVSFAACTTKSDLQWNQKEGYHWAELSPGYFGKTGFTKLSSSSTGLKFVNNIERESIEENRNYMNGSGVAAGDIDGDGWIDLYFAQIDGPNKLFKNLGGMKFKDITEKSGLSHERYHSTGVVFADVDGDNDLDLLITSLTGQNTLYINDGEGHFKLKQNSGLGASKGSNTMALADIDGDGDLDLYISNYVLKSVKDIYSEEELLPRNMIRKKDDSLLIDPPFDKYFTTIQTKRGVSRVEYGSEDELYLNNGKGLFEKVNDLKQYFLDENGNPQGLTRDWGLSVKFQDINGDLAPDLFVTNDFWTPDRFWINQGNGTFKLINRKAIPSLSFSSMGIDFSDINRDGNLDFIVTEMLSDVHERRMQQFTKYQEAKKRIHYNQYNRNSLYLNRGDDTFAEISHYANLFASEWSWTTNFLDVDLDSYEDLIITTGYAHDYLNLDSQIELNRRRSSNTQSKSNNLFKYPPLKLGNKIFHNNQDLTFSEKSKAWGFHDQDISLGMAVADLDNDGDPDLIINRFNEEALIYKNKTNAPRIAVKLDGKSPNTQGIGAKVELFGADAQQSKEIAAGGTYVSGSQAMAFFAADPDNPDHTLKVTWRNGLVSTIDSVKANRIYVVDEKFSQKSVINNNNRKKESLKPLFKDISDQIDHVHHEDPFNDFKIQELLPVKLSQKGPGVSWLDFDQDGDDDLFVSSGKGGILAIFENLGRGEFKKIELDQISNAAFGDQTTVLGWNTNNYFKLVVGRSSYEQRDRQIPLVKIYNIYKNGKVSQQSIEGISSVTGPLAAADYTGDGQIDLFVGGSFKAGQYPANATSRLYKNENGSFKLDKKNSKLMSEIGLISGAVFSDFDSDGDPDLLLSREWDSILVLENDNGQFKDVSDRVGLQKYKGWWNGITTGDFNNDGRLDIIATNLGENSIYQIESNKPLKLFYGDFNRDGRTDIFDSYYNSSLGGYVPRRKLYDFKSIPALLQYVKSHETFAKFTMDKMFGRNLNKVSSKEINTLQHMLFLNKENSFEAIPLPSEAQFSSVYHPAVADFDNDGNEDLFLSQNFFPFPSGIPLLNSGRGLLLKGDGKGNLQVVKGYESGIEIYGEQRGAAVSDFNSDGKSDLVITQNQAETKLFLNQTERIGLRFKLNGPPSNRDAIGSAFRLKYRDGSYGPLREIQAGTGYWSQHSTIHVMGYSSKFPNKLEVYWFDGNKELINITHTTKEMTINYEH